jgi:hypothetical protein
VCVTDRDKIKSGMIFYYRFPEHAFAAKTDNSDIDLVLHAVATYPIGTFV